MPITAKTVKANVQSLLAKANKETGKEHTNLSDAFEDLALGYGVDQTEVFDGNIELEGEFEPGEPEITDYYQNGYDKGYADKTAENNQLARDFSIIVYGEQKNEAIENVVNTAITDIGYTKGALEEFGVEVYKMPTSALPKKINEVYEKGKAAGKLQGRNGYAEELLPYNQNLQVALKGYATGSTDKEVMEQATSDINAIEAKIEEKGVSLPMLTPSSAFPEKIEEVYEKGYEKGKTESDYNTAFEEGKLAERKAFWDNYLDNGNRTDFDQAISGKGWTIEVFKPNHDMFPTTAYMMFRKSDMKIDLVEYLKKMGVKLDFSNCKNHLYIFSFSSFTRVGVVDFSKSTASTACDNAFGYCHELVTIDKIILRKGTNAMFASASFTNCDNLVNVIFDGELESNGLNLQWSTKLSKASWVNIVGCYSTTISGLSMTGSLASVNSAFETSEGANDGSKSAEWLNLIATRPNVAFNLV